ncbi:hypothetical protein [Neptunicella sp. SCSIO 80796]|uniref:hypothetical protein n=1 Tax=Neptunicella plasticusilytica TaxID=3117012 RepID=UPI003A4E5941
MLWRLFTSRQGYRFGLCFLTILIVSTMLVFVPQQASSVNLSDYYHYQCDMQDKQSNNPRFRFLTVSSLYVDRIAQRLCRSPVMAEHYSGVTISWKPRWLLSPTEVVNENYDLIWSRENALRGLVPGYQHYYQLLMAFDNYKVYWFSKGQTPILEQAYFENKRVGILTDRLSQTHHLLPLMSLKDANIQLSDQQLIAFDDARNLYQAFATGEIDLMTGGDWLQREIDAPISGLLISDKVNAASLFIRKSHPPAVDCALVRVMETYQETLLNTHIQPDIDIHCDAS